MLLLMMIFNFYVYAEEDVSWIADISLIKSKIFDDPTPPAEIPIGVELTTEAFYKISNNERTIKGGLFHMGLNILHLDASHFFEESGSHVYFLDLKRGDLILRKKIEIDIQVDSQKAVMKPDEKIENPEYRLSMYIGDELIITSKKLPHKDIPLKIDMPPWPGEYKPFGPVDTSEYGFNSFSIFSAVGAILDMLKKLKKEKEEERSIPVERHKQIITTFLRMNSEGITQEVKAVITIRTGE